MVRGKSSISRAQADHNHPTDYVAISDSLAFLLIMFLAAKTKTPGLRVESILGTIAADAMRYFLVIFTAHFVLILTLNLAPVRAVVRFFGP